MLFIYSSEHGYVRSEWEELFLLAKSVGQKPLDIINCNKKKIMKSLTINKKKYEKFKYDFLTPKDKTLIDTPNYKILNKLSLTH